MTHLLITKRCLALVAVCTAAACSNKDSVKLGSAYVVAEDVGASGATLIVSSTEIAGTRLAIPEGALTESKRITITVGATDIVDASGVVSGPVVELGPDGTVFNKPVVLTLPYRGDIDTKRLKVWMKDASGLTVLPGHVLALDRENKTVRFQIMHFTDFQAGTGSAPVECDDVSECGPALGLPNWTCADGQIGGPTGRCLRQDDGTCGWEIIQCEAVCAADECGLAPAIAVQCDDGSTAVMSCDRDATGACGWTWSCPAQCDPSVPGTDPATTCGSDCTAGQICPDGTQCDAATGHCQPNGQECGSVVCGAGEACCNASCSQCAPIGWACTEQACPTCADGSTCPPGQECDAATGSCSGLTGEACGPTVCAAGQYCCNESCGVCAAPDGACPAIACTPCDATTCAPGEVCDANGSCAPACSAADCGPQPGLASWMCEDGSTGGFTGNCIPNASTASPTCVWEIIQCPAACDATECGPQPGAAPMCPADPAGSTTGTYECHRAADGSCAWIINC